MAPDSQLGAAGANVHRRGKFNKLMAALIDTMDEHGDGQRQALPMAALVRLSHCSILPHLGSQRQCASIPAGIAVF